MIRLLVLLGWVLLSPGAQGQTAGLYQILSGSYTTCCGIAGAVRSALPTTDQAFFRLSTDQQSSLWRMTFLDQQLRTNFSVSVCSPGDPIQFDFGYGFGLSDSIVFHVDPGPAPYHLFWNYTVSNSA